MEVLRESPASLREILAGDDALLRRGEAAVRVSVVSEAGLTFGVGTPRDGAAEARARALGLPAVQRSTGGTGILHLPGDLVWSIVLPRSDPMVGPDFSSAYGRLGAGLVVFLADLDLDGRWSEPEALSDEFCLLGRRGRALTVNGRVLGGAAQHVTASALLHHGVVGRTVEPTLIDRIFRLGPSVVADRLTSLEMLGIHATSDQLADALAQCVAASLGGPRSR